ncbi:MAG: VOC family protein [Deltaproteobacteria bacterium]
MSNEKQQSRRDWMAAAGAAWGAAMLTASAAKAADGTWPPITAYPTGRSTPGRWVWGDLFVDDVAGAQRFYGAVFGWRFDRTDALDGRYILAHAGDELVAGLVAVTVPTARARGSHWLPFMSVTDPAAAARAASSGGGRVLLAPQRLVGRGDVAVLADPEGTAFGVMRPEGGEADDYLAELNEWVWLELWAHDAPRAVSFLQQLAGYTVESHVGPAGELHTQLVAQGHARASVRQTPFPTLPAAWIPFVRVADAAAAAARVLGAGGRVAVSPQPQLLDGRVAVFIDPGGAPIGVLVPSEGAT